MPTKEICELIGISKSETVPVPKHCLAMRESPDFRHEELKKEIWPRLLPSIVNELGAACWQPPNLLQNDMINMMFLAKEMCDILIWLISAQIFMHRLHTIELRLAVHVTRDE